MKTKYLLVLVSAVLLAGGCVREEVPEIPGRTILKARLEQSGTRVTIGDADGKMNWSEGDEIAVHVGSDYQTVPIDPTNSQLSVDETQATRNYFAVYPASIAVAGDYGNPDLKITLPASYDVSDIVAGNKTTDFAPLPMVASNDPEDDVLDFYHVGGLLRVNLNGVLQKTKFVRVTFDKDVTGTYTVAYPGDPGSMDNTDNGNTQVTFPTITTAGTDANKTVTFTLTGNKTLGATLAQGTIVLNVPVPCGSYNWVKVECLDRFYSPIASKTYDDKVINFLRHHGKRLNESELVFYFGSLRDYEVSYKGGTASMSSGFVSYKEEGYSQTKVPFTLEYSEDGGTTWTQTPPSWMTVTNSPSLSGSTLAMGLTYKVDPQKHQIDGVDVHHEELKKDSRAKNDFDLSTINVATGATVARTTANCYVVQGSGTYKFPLVYGNGVVGGVVNDSAFRGKEGVDGSFRPDDGIRVGYLTMYTSYYLGRFKDHFDQNITSPYIATQQSGKTLTAELLWTDEPDLVTDVALAGSGEDTYLTFNVPSASITQGNALVAVLADGVIAWSWHIWVTEEDLTRVGEGASGYFFAPVNIGWCDTKPGLYPKRICKVRATQSITGTVLEATLTQKEYEFTILGSNPFFQWGRKDPIQAPKGWAESGDLKQYYPSSDTYSPTVNRSQVSIGQAIQHPYYYYRPYDTVSDNERASFCDTHYQNLWDSTCNSEYTITGIPDIFITKTIYDPSPVGYKVPSFAAYEGFTTSTSEWILQDQRYGRLWNGIFFPATGQHDEYFPSFGVTITRQTLYYLANPDYVTGGAQNPGLSFYFSENDSGNGVDGSNSGAQSVRPIME